jgi:hypothetical protein
MNTQGINLTHERNRLRQYELKTFVHSAGFCSRYQLTIILVGPVDKSFSDEVQRVSVCSALHLAVGQTDERCTRRRSRDAASHKVCKLSIINGVVVERTMWFYMGKRCALFFGGGDKRVDLLEKRNS